MAPSACIDLDKSQRSLLLGVARRSIAHGFLRGGSYTVEKHEQRAVTGPAYGVFTTLSLSGALRGCIGSMELDTPLAQAVSDTSYSAAFRDYRFSPLGEDELERVEVEISVLSNPEPLAVATRRELLGALAPGLDGLLLEDGRHRATFLPKVWEQLPEPGQFLARLLDKAGLPADHWSDSLRVSRYRALAFSEREIATDPATRSAQ